jgi:hypothetical protein
VIYFPLDVSMRYKEGQGAMMTTTASTTLPCPTMIKAIVERICSSCSLLSLVLVFLVLRYYVASGENFKAKAWEKVCRRQFLFNKLSTRMCKFTRMYNFFVKSTPEIAPIGETINSNSNTTVSITSGSCV